MKVYLSCTTDLEQLGDAVARELQAPGITAVVTMPVPEPGTRLDDAKKLLNSCDAVVFLIGRMRSSLVEWEWSTAFEDSWTHPEKKLIPVVLQSCAVPSFLRDRLQITVRDPFGEQEAVREAVKSALAGKSDAGTRNTATNALVQKERLQVLEKQSAALQPSPKSVEEQARSLESLLAGQLEAGDNAGVAKSAAKLADFMKFLNRMEDCLKYQKIALDAVSKDTSKDPAVVARTHSGIASTFETLGQYPEAIAHTEKALALHKKGKSANTLAAAVTELNLASLLKKVGRQEEANAFSAASTRTMANAAVESWGNVPFLGSLVKRIAAGILKPKGVPTRTVTPPAVKLAKAVPTRVEAAAKPVVKRAAVKRAPAKTATVRKKAATASKRKASVTAKKAKAARAVKTRRPARTRKAG